MTLRSQHPAPRIDDNAVAMVLRSFARRWRADEVKGPSTVEVLAMEYAADRLGDEPSDGSANCPRFSIAVEALRNIRDSHLIGPPHSKEAWETMARSQRQIAREVLAEFGDKLSGRASYDTRLIELMRTRIKGLEQ